MLSVTVILQEARPSGKILLMLFEYVLCQSTWSEPQAVDVTAHAAWIRGSLSSLACQVDCSLFQRIDTNTHMVHTHTRSLRDAWMYTCVLANRCTNTTCSHTLQGQTEGGRESYWACKPLIRSTQIWYHCNQISDGAEYSMSGFGQSSVTFVAEKWHGALVPNAITELASCTLRTVEDTWPTAEEDRLTLDQAHTCNSIYEQRQTLLTGAAEVTQLHLHCVFWSVLIHLSYSRHFFKEKQRRLSLQREASVCIIFHSW